MGGTSIGALVGGLYCDDCDVEKMLERTRVFSTKMAAYRDKFFDLTWPTTSMFTGKVHTCDGTDDQKCVYLFCIFQGERSIGLCTKCLERSKLRY